jgi:AcrR family transcriptional regulator
MNSKAPVAGPFTRSGRTAKSDLTRERILAAARRLFNEQGTSVVSTNHIAAEAGLSPGNLYYHFADKQEIVRALHAQYAAAHEERWQPVLDASENLAQLRRNLAAGLELAWEYRFLEREILALLRADPELRVAYREVYERRVGEWLAFGEQLVAQGLLRPPRPPRTLRDLTVALWLVAQGWLPFLDLTGDPQNPRQVARGIELVLVVLDPYLTSQGRRAFAAAPARTAGKESRAR